MSCHASWKEAVLHLAEFQGSSVQGVRVGVLRNVAANSAGKKSCWRRALQLLPSHGEAGAKNALVAHGIAVDSCARAASWARALQMLQSWALQGQEASLVALGAAARGLAGDSCDRWRLAQLLASEAPSIFVSNAVLAACCRARLLQQSLRLLSAMKQDGPEPDVASYNTMLGLCAEEGHVAKAGALLREARHQGLQGLLMHNLALKASLSASSWERAAGLLLGMSVDRVASDDISTGTAIASCARGRRWQLCIRLLRTLPFRELPWQATPGRTVAFSTAGSAAIQAMAWSCAQDFLDDLRCSHLQTDTDTFAAFSTACMAAAAGAADAQGGPRSRRTWRIWPLAAALLCICKQRHGVAPDTSVGPAITTFSRSSRWPKGVQLLAGLRANGLRPHLICFNSAAMSTWRAVSSALSGMCAGALRPDVASWNALLVANPWEQSTQSLEVMAALQVEVDQVAVSTRLGGMNAAPWRKSLAALCRASAGSVDGILAAVLLRGCAARRSWQESLQLRASLEWGGSDLRSDAGPKLCRSSKNRGM